MSQSDQPYQVMPDLDDDEFDRLKDDIRVNGIEYPIILDSNGEIIDGHHRYQAWVELGRDPDNIPTRVVDDTDDENYHRAYRANLLRRDLSDGTKRKVVKQYLLEHPDRVVDDSQEAIAQDLGVGQSTVDRAIDELEESGKLTQVGELSTDEKRQQVRDYVEDKPTASNREVAREVDCDVTHVTVGNWRDEWDIQEPTTGLDTFTNAKSEADKARDVAQKATSDEVDNDIQQEAQEQAERLSRGETSPQTASKNVEKAEAEKAVETEREPDTAIEPKITVSEAVPWLIEDAPVADALITDPPFSTDIDDVADFASLWVPAALDRVAPDGYAYIFTGSYTDELYAYSAALRHTEFAVQPLVWNYRNTLGRSPTDRYKRDWQCIFYCRGPDAGDLNAPKTSELRSVQEVNAPGMVGDESERHHRWQKPHALIEQFVRHSTSEGDTVIDPFAGSGQHLLTSAELGRDAYGCDLDEDAVETAIERGCVQRE